MKEVINFIDSLILRYENIMSMPTGEINVELKKIKEMIETPEAKLVKEVVKKTEKAEPKQQPTKEKTIKELRAEYKEKFQKNPFN
jgi:ABC-type oligopeptide transport system ATPase subunit